MKYSIVLSRENGVALHQPGQVAGVADIALHGVYLRCHGWIGAILRSRNTSGRCEPIRKYIRCFHETSTVYIGEKTFIPQPFPWEHLYRSSPTNCAAFFSFDRDVSCPLCANLDVEPLVVVGHVVVSGCKCCLLRRHRDRVQGKVLQQKLRCARSRCQEGSISTASMETGLDIVNLSAKQQHKLHLQASGEAVQARAFGPSGHKHQRGEQ